MPEDSNFEDESFDLSEIEDSVGTGPIFSSLELALTMTRVLASKNTTYC